MSSSLGLFLRLLAAVAWADGQVSPAEEAFLARLLDESGASPEERAAVTALLRTPVSREEFTRQATEFEERVEDPAERRALIEQVERLIGADAQRAPSEIQYLQILRSQLLTEPASEAASPARASRSEGLFGVFRAARDHARALGASLGLGTAAAAEQSPREEYVTLFGALLHRVAFADGVVSPAEEAKMRELLGSRFGFSPSEVERVVVVAHQRLSAAEGRQRLSAELNRITDMHQRVDVIEALFALAAAGGGPSPQEEEEIRMVSNYLWVETRDYVRLRAAARARG